MCMGDAKEIELLYNRLKEFHAHEINAYRSKDTYIEISHIRQDKASALAFLLNKKYPSLSMQNVIAFGDNYNDKTLLEQVGIGVAVANAKPEIIAIADSVSFANTEDGVAHYLAKLS